MGVDTPSSRLYKEGRAHFVRECEARYSDPKDLALLRDFLSQQGSPEEARFAAGALKADAGKKYGSKKVGDTEIPGAWIDQIMSNIGNFVAVGNYAMTGAPESVGLAWFAVKLTLSAIQSNYDLYNFFGAGLTDISEIMILIPHYDRMYDERDRAKAEKSDFKPSPILDKLYQDIVSTYAAVLNFSFSIKRHLSAGTLAKLRHGFKDFLGTSKTKFQGKIDAIAVMKKKILEGSQAIFQDKTLQGFGVVKGVMSSIQGTVNEIRQFQNECLQLQERQAEQWQLVMQKMDDMKATTKPKTPWDLALQEWEKNKKALNPSKDTSDALMVAIDKRHPGTCQWIFNNSGYRDWKETDNSKMLCLVGQRGFGKSTVLATIVEHLGVEEAQVRPGTLLYLSCGSTGRGQSSGAAPTVDEVCHTLLYQLYHLAAEDESKTKLLEDCNKVFKNPKASKKGSAMLKSHRDESLPDFSDAFCAIAEHLEINVVIALDEINVLSAKDQQELGTKLKAILEPVEATPLPIKIIAGCRSGTKFHNLAQSIEGRAHCVEVGANNHDDILLKLFAQLKDVPGLTEAEQDEAAKAIVERAGPRFAYIDDIAVPFMREPFQRPLSRRLQQLPEGMNNVYSDALRAMAPNYVELLRTALTWTLFAPVSPKVEEIMDAYNGVFATRGPDVEARAFTLEAKPFRGPPELEIEQLRDACGPFLRLEHERDYHLVMLQDGPRVRDFCLHSPEADDKSAHEDGALCTRCKGALSETRTFAMSPKEAHLDLALTCLRHLNNPIFQKHATANDPDPLWCESKAPDDTNGAEIFENKASSNAGTEAINEEVTREPATLDAEVSDEAPNNEPERDKDQEEAPTDEGGTADDSGYDTDDSMDDEDRGEINLAKALESGNIDEETDGPGNAAREERYEMKYWTYHLRQADELWAPEERANSTKWKELFEELDVFVTTNLTFFNRWQKEQGAIAGETGTVEALHVASFFGLTSWAEYLLVRKGADPNQVSGTLLAKTPIQMAAYAGDSRPMLKLLLESGADINFESKEVDTAFGLWLLRDSSAETIKLMLKHGANPVAPSKLCGWTAMFYFAWGSEDDIEALDVLLNHTVDGVKPDINARDDQGKTPLHMLLMRRDIPKTLLRAFIDHGADVNSEDDVSSRPLQMASIWGELETMRILTDGKPIDEIDDPDKDGDTALHQATYGPHPKCVKFLLELGANPNAQNNRGRTSLQNVAGLESKESAEALLAHGADPNMRDKHNRTSLFFACLGDSVEIAMMLLDLLLEKGLPLSEINMLTKRHRSPLRQAAGKGFREIVQKLIETAQSQNSWDDLAINVADEKKGMTPLHRAAWFGKEECVRLLIEVNADVSMKDKNNKTALVLAYEQWALASHENSFENIISLLIARAPEAARCDAELVAISAINGSTRILEQLNGIGADLNRPDRYGWTPLDLARKFNQEAAGQYLKQQAAWAGMLPSRWAPDPRTDISADGKIVKHVTEERICISTDKPLPAGLDTFYYEVYNKAVVGPPYTPSWAEVAIGFCTIGGKAIRFPGWPARMDAPSAKSWGYHGDDGGLYCSEQENSRAEKDLPYESGHTVGCGVDLTTGTIWFTRNGKKIDGNFENVQGRLFPLLGLVDPVELETNFTGPFLWKGEDSVQG